MKKAKSELKIKRLDLSRAARENKIYEAQEIKRLIDCGNKVNDIGAANSMACRSVYRLLNLLIPEIGAAYVKGIISYHVAQALAVLDPLNISEAIRHIEKNGLSERMAIQAIKNGSATILDKPEPADEYPIGSISKAWNDLLSAFEIFSKSISQKLMDYEGVGIACRNRGNNIPGVSIEKIISEMVSGYADNNMARFTPCQILNFLRSKGKLEAVIGNVEEPRRAIGWKIKPLINLQMKDSKGRVFEIRRRNLVAGVEYCVEFL